MFIINYITLCKNNNFSESKYLRTELLPKLPENYEQELKKLWWNDFPSKMIFQINQKGELSHAIIETIIKRWELLYYLSKVDSGFKKYIVKKLEIIRSSLVSNLNASGVFTEESVSKALGEILWTDNLTTEQDETKHRKAWAAKFN